MFSERQRPLRRGLDCPSNAQSRSEPRFIGHFAGLTTLGSESLLPASNNTRAFVMVGQATLQPLARLRTFRIFLIVRVAEIYTLTYAFRYAAGADHALSPRSSVQSNSPPYREGSAEVCKDRQRSELYAC